MQCNEEKQLHISMPGSPALPHYNSESSFSICSEIFFKQTSTSQDDLHKEFSEKLPELDQNGYLDWSGKGLSTFPRQKFTEICTPGRPELICLNISRNLLRSIDCAFNHLEKCKEIDASHNELFQLRSLHPLAQTLENLNLCDNRISSLGGLDSFLHLCKLDLSHNRIENFPLCNQLLQLTLLNLYSNHLKNIPDLSQLSALTHLKLHGNVIHTLEGISARLPVANLILLDLGGNLISDLTEMHFLHGLKALKSLIVLDNPCTPPGLNDQQFSYRPFVYSCVLGELKFLDGISLREEEIIKGEWLHAQGRTRSFRPHTGSHDALCVYLTKECPLLATDEIYLEDNEKLKRVVQKRREYRSRDKLCESHQQQFISSNISIASTTNNLLAVTSKESKSTNTTPINNIEKSQLMNVADSSKPSNSENLLASMVITPKKQQKLKLITPISAVVSAQNEQLGIQQNWAVNSTVENSQSSTSTSSNNSSTTIILSKNESITAPTSNSIEQIKPNIPANRRKTYTLISQQNLPMVNTTRSPLTSRIPTASPRVAKALNSSNRKAVSGENSIVKSIPSEVADITSSVNSIGGNGKKKSGFRSVLTGKFRRTSGISATQSPRFQSIQKSIDDLWTRNSLFTSINEDHVKTFQHIAEKFQELEREVKKQAKQNQELRQLLVPTPSNLTCQRLEEGSKVLVSWQNTLPLLDSVDHYELLINGRTEKILARNKRLLITDTDPNAELKISLQSVASKLGNARSQQIRKNLCEKNVFNTKNCYEEEKENLQNSDMDKS